MQADAPRARSARAVPDAPVHALVSRSEGLAKGWLIALLERRPLARAAAVPTAGLAARGPGLCAVAARALASDEALAELQALHAPSLAGLSGAVGPAAIVEAAEALRAILWAALLETLPEPRPGQLADLADRLALLTSGLLAAALSDRAPAPTVEDQGENDGGVGGRPVASPLTAVRDRQPTPEPAPGAGLWRDALERRLGGGGRPGERTSLLLVELDDVERMRAAGELDGLLERAGLAIRREARRGDLVAHESDGRTWVLAAESGRPAAEALARRIAAGIAAVGGEHGAPLTVSIGLAVHPDDGLDAGALSAHAEEDMLAARAAGLPVGGERF